MDGRARRLVRNQEFQLMDNGALWDFRVDPYRPLLVPAEDESPAVTTAREKLTAALEAEPAGPPARPGEAEGDGSGKDGDGDGDN